MKRLLPLGLAVRLRGVVAERLEAARFRFRNANRHRFSLNLGSCLRPGAVHEITMVLTSWINCQ